MPAQVDMLMYAAQNAWSRHAVLEAIVAATRAAVDDHLSRTFWELTNPVVMSASIDARRDHQAVLDHVGAAFRTAGAQRWKLMTIAPTNTGTVWAEQQTVDRRYEARMEDLAASIAGKLYKFTDVDSGTPWMGVQKRIDCGHKRAQVDAPPSPHDRQFLQSDDAAALIRAATLADAAHGEGEAAVAAVRGVLRQMGIANV